MRKAGIHCSPYALATAEPSGDREDQIREMLSYLGRKLEEICFSCQCAFTFPIRLFPDWTVALDHERKRSENSEMEIVISISCLRVFISLTTDFQESMLHSVKNLICCMVS